MPFAYPDPEGLKLQLVARLREGALVSAVCGRDAVCLGADAAALRRGGGPGGDGVSVAGPTSRLELFAEFR